MFGYRTRLIKAYARASRAEQMRQLLAATDAHFRQEGRWTEPTLAALASVCLETDLHQESAAYFEELIALHQRTAPNRGIGNGTLSNYYSQLAQVYSALGETKKAVDAASAGVVAWGPRHDQRQDSIRWLRRVLAHAKDLDAYVEHLDQQAAETGQDSPLVRQQIGLVYAERGEHVKAIAQLRIAVELQPRDLLSHQALIASYKAVGDQQAVVEQMLAQLDLDRHNP